MVRFLINAWISILTWIGSDISAQPAEYLSLDTYTCGQFLSDARKADDGEKIIRSLMMISWATGYVAAHQKIKARADSQGLQLVAAALGEACKGNEKERVVLIFTTVVDKLAEAMRSRK
jgi:hypothetical protein